MLLHNCVGVEYWENELVLNKDDELKSDEGWDDEDEPLDLEAEGIQIINVEDLNASFED